MTELNIKELRREFTDAADGDWIWIGENENAEVLWIVGDQCEVRDYHDDAHGIEYEGDRRKGSDIIHAPVSRIVAALAAVPQLLDIVEQLPGVLGFYADERAYDPDELTPWKANAPEIERDRGQQARALLTTLRTLGVE